MTASSVVFSARDHSYRLDGQRLVSVTQALGIIDKPGLTAWMLKLGLAEANRQRDEAAEFGTATHAICEQIANGHGGAALDCPDEFWPLANAYNGWFQSNVRRVIAAEPRVASRAFGYAGSIDLVADMTDGLGVAVLDLKTGSLVPETTPHQLAAYQRALLEDLGVDAPRRISVHLPRKRPGELTAHEYPVTEAAEDFRIFLCALLLFKRFAKKERR